MIYYFLFSQSVNDGIFFLGCEEDKTQKERLFLSFFKQSGLAIQDDITDGKGPMIPG
jgi:hypothetical protein